MRRMQAQGFTLTELMVVIAIIAILLTIGLPSFRETLQRNGVATLTNEVIGSLSLARSEAIRTSRGGGICASSDGATCGGGWDSGWLVWANQGAVNGTLDSGDLLIRRIDPHPAMVVAATSTASGAAVTIIVFDARGRVLTPSTVSLQPASCRTGRELVRTLTVNAAGQVKTARSNCA